MPHMRILSIGLVLGLAANFISIPNAFAGAGDDAPAAKTDAKVPAKIDAKKTTTTKGDKKMEKTPHVIIETSEGKIEVELNHEKAPISVDNFLKYTDEGFYSGTIFHRVIKNFMVQGGGFDDKMDQKKTHDQIKNEASNGLKNDKYTLAMARTNVVDSATAQFFINTKTNDFLNYRDASPSGYGYAVFGKVVSGQDVVDKIEASPTTTKGGMGDVPTKTVTIKSVKRK